MTVKISVRFMTTRRTGSFRETVMLKCWTLRSCGVPSWLKLPNIRRPFRN